MVKKGTLSQSCVCEETEKFRKNSYFSDLCSRAFTMIIYFSYNASIHFKPMFQLWKNWFLRKWNTVFKWVKPIPKENYYSRSWFCLFFKNRQEQTEIKLSNKFFPFFQFWHQLYYLYFRQHFTLMWNLKKQFLNLYKCCFKLFRILQIEYIKKHIQVLQTVWKCPLCLQYFRLRLNMVHLHRVSTKNELFNWILSDVIRSWLVGTSNAIESSCNR